MKSSTNAKGKNGKEFLPNVGFWPAKSGKGYTLFVSDKIKEILENTAVGSTLYLAEVESDNENAPTYRVTVMPPRDEQTEAGI